MTLTAMLRAAVEVDALFGQPDGFVAEGAVGAGECAEDEGFGEVDDEGAPREHAVVAGLDRAVGQVAQRGPDHGAECDEQTGHTADRGCRVRVAQAARVSRTPSSVASSAHPSVANR